MAMHQEKGDSRESTPPVEQAEPSELIVGRSVKTRVLERINGGSFGEIYLGKLVENEQEVAIKIEHQKSPNTQLLHEGNVYKHLEGGPGIPAIHWFGLYEPIYNVLVIELLGPSLQDLFAYCDHKFTLKTVLMLADQMFDILQYVHSRHFIHRDIKPDNFMIGLGEKRNKVYIIDFGLAKKIGHRLSFYGSNHFQMAHHLVGTVRYASVHAHMGHEESMRDDVEALGYVFVYFLKGRLPWQGLDGCNKAEKIENIKTKKLSLTLKELCSDLPPLFSKYVDYCRGMKYNEPPNYENLHKLFRDLARESNIEYDDMFDWVLKEKETGIPAINRQDHGHNSS